MTLLFYVMQLSAWKGVCQITASELDQHSEGLTTAIKKLYNITRSELASLTHS